MNYSSFPRLLTQDLTTLSLVPRLADKGGGTQDKLMDTLTEHGMQMQMEEISILGSARKADLAMILDFVERWNKQDKESNVSEAAARLAMLLVDKNDSL